MKNYSCDNVTKKVEDVVKRYNKGMGSEQSFPKNAEQE